MTKTAFGSGGWDPQPYHEQVRAQKPRIIPSDVSTVHDVPLPKNQPADSEELPYPVLCVNATSRVHLVPVYSGLYVLLTDPETGRIKSNVRPNADFWVTYQGRLDVATDLVDGMHSHYTPEDQFVDDFLGTIEDTEWLSDPFDCHVTDAFRPPAVRWLRNRTRSVEYSGPNDPNSPSTRGEWKINFDQSREANAERTVSLPHSKLLSGQASVFTSRYKSSFPFQSILRLSQAWWFDLSRFFIDEATYSGATADQFSEQEDRNYIYRQSGAGTYHLLPEGEERAVCGSSVRSTTTQPFDPQGHPLPAAICPNCTPTIKRQRIGAAID